MDGITGSAVAKDRSSKRKYKDNKASQEIPSAPAPAPAAAVGDHARASEEQQDDQRKSADKLLDEPITKKTKLPEHRQSHCSSIIDCEELRHGSGSGSRLEEGPEQAKKRLEKMCSAVRTLLECVGEDPDREGLLATPSRYAKALMFLTKGYHIDVDTIVNNALFHEVHKEIIVVKDIDIYSLCEHHLVPFTGKMHIGYIPSAAVIGISKLPRIAEVFARRLQIQERLTRQVADVVMELLSPRGVAVVMESSHLCMVMRGIQKSGIATITSCVRGCFEKKSKRDEFLRLIGVDAT